MQELVEDKLSSKMLKFLDEVVEEKKQKSSKVFSKTDVESIFNMIEDED